MNCIPVTQVSAALQLLRKLVPSDMRIGAYANAGHVGDDGWSAEHGVLPREYAQAAQTWRDIGATIIGGGCGATPEHIRMLRNELIQPAQKGVRLL